MEKTLLRREILSSLRRYEKKKEESSLILSTLTSLPLFEEAETILAFSPLPSEPDISPILKDERVLLPFITGEGEMEFGKGQVEKNSLGFYEPKEKKACFYEKALILVPLIALDSNLYRLGRGKGFYDRYLEKNRERLISLALAFTPSIVDEIEREEWDQKVDAAIIGDGRVIIPGRARDGIDISLS